MGAARGERLADAPLDSNPSLPAPPSVRARAPSPRDGRAADFSLSLASLPAPASFSRSSSKVELPKAVKPAVLAAVTNAVVALPSLAGEPGKIFDFNLTLPIIATEFLLLMVILDKTVFGPVGKAIDDRDKLIRDQLSAVGDNSTAVADLIVRDPTLPASATRIRGERDPSRSRGDRASARRVRPERVFSQRNQSRVFSSRPARVRTDAN